MLEICPLQPETLESVSVSSQSHASSSTSNTSTQKLLTHWYLNCYRYCEGKKMGIENAFYSFFSRPELPCVRTLQLPLPEGSSNDCFLRGSLSVCMLWMCSAQLRAFPCVCFCVCSLSRLLLLLILVYILKRLTWSKLKNGRTWLPASLYTPNKCVILKFVTYVITSKLRNHRHV